MAPAIYPVLCCTKKKSELCFSFFGPFKVLAWVGAVAYKLDLPDDCRIHPVVHVSQLKRQVPPTAVVTDDLSTIPVDPEAENTPVQVLESHVPALFQLHKSKLHGLLYQLGWQLGRSSMTFKGGIPRV